MKAIYSYWDTTGNLTKSAGNWLNPQFMFYSLVHSAKKSKEIFGRVEMITTTKCKPIFDKLEIFDAVGTELDEISHYPRSLWALGKIKAYSIQTEPFIHIDNDLQLEDASVLELSKNYDFIVQELEDRRYENTGKPFATGWYHTYIPTIQYLKEYDGYVNPNYVYQVDYAYNMGVYGCKDLDFNKRYCKEVFKTVDKNLQLFVDYEKNTKYPNHNVSCYFEQYLIAQMIHFEKKQDKVFRVIQDAEYNYYRHLLFSKKDENIYNWFKKAVEIGYPKQYEIINQLINT